MFLFRSYVEPGLLDVADLRAEQAVVADAISKAREVIRLRDELRGTYNSISNADIEKIRKFLPAGSAISELFIDLDVIAKDARMEIGKVSFVEESVPQGGTSAGIKTLTVTLSLNGSYDDFMKFLDLVEKNLRLVDAVRISLLGSGGVDTPVGFEVTLQAYYQDRTIL
ncbi:MAG: hypothetical protein G01um101429_871 [Parcubacteria group bacterium Gr01-1014_29]|nr:MAG: hypothetical protein G01um101429_871 [Parcubacteria group bacterium Gr01-1014_29]